MVGKHNDKDEASKNQRIFDGRVDFRNIGLGSGIGSVGLLGWIILELAKGGTLGCNDCVTRMELKEFAGRYATTQDIELVYAKQGSLSKQVGRNTSDLNSRAGKRFNMNDWYHLIEPLNNRVERLERYRDKN